VLIAGSSSTRAAACWEFFLIANAGSQMTKALAKDDQVEIKKIGTDYSW
jgi:hypothetical protein